MADLLTVRDRCFWCRRREADRDVSVEGQIVGCCDTCWLRSEDEMRVPLDMEEDGDA